MAATKAKPARVLRVLSRINYRLLRVLVVEGKKSDEYTVAAEDGAYWWTHATDAHRRYRVDCLPCGRPNLCDCPSLKTCRHLAGSIVLVARGDILPPACDEMENVSDYREDAEAAGEWYDRSPDRLADDEYADVLGRRIVQEVGGI